MIKYIKLCFLAIYQALFYCLDSIIKSDKKLICFYVTDKTFGDNIKFFYQDTLQKNEFKPILIFQDKQLYNSLKDIPNSFSVWSFAGILNFLKSGICIIQNGDAKLFFFPLLLNPKTKFILNLWHGIPLKKLNRQVKEYQQRRFSFQYQSLSALVVCSEFEKLLMASCFYMDLDKIWVTGTPRNDKLLSLQTPNSVAHLKNKNIVLYAPTWREYGNNTSFFPFDDFDETALINKLKTNDQYLLLRGHRLEMGLLLQKYSALIKSTDRIIIADQNLFPDVNDLLKVTDLLITDYSSIYLDFLLMNKPINFIPYDMDEYKQYRGFLIDYNSNTPGPKIKTFEDFLNKLNRTSIDNHHTKLKELFHFYDDSKAQERINVRLRKTYH